MTRLGLEETGVTDLGLQHLSVFKKLEILDILNCARLSDVGLVNLGGLPIGRLNLGESGWLTDVGIANLAGLPLAQLNVRGCPSLSTECREGLVGLQEAWNAVPIF